MLALGIDPGPTNSHYALLRIGVKWELVAYGEVKSNPDGVHELGDLLVDKYFHTGTMCIGLETPIFMGRGAAVNNLLGTARALGRFDMWLHLASSKNDHVHLYNFTSTTWRKAVVGKGNAKDMQIREHLREQMPDLPAALDVHKYDAIGVALYAAFCCNKKEGTNA